MQRPFPRSQKVRRHADFQRIQSSASGHAGDVGRATSSHFVFLVARTPGDGVQPPRLGLVVTRKVGSAVERNRVRRVCRECFRLWPDFVPPGIDLIVIARQGAPTLGLAQVRDEWSRARGALRHRVRETLARAPEEPHVSARPPAGGGADDPSHP